MENRNHCRIARGVQSAFRDATSWRRWLACIVLLLPIAGCSERGPMGRAAPLPTEATLHSGDEVLSEVQITLHVPWDDGFLPVAFGVTDAEGRCQIRAMASQEALALPAGEYRCTLGPADETASVTIPVEFADVNSTPLTFSWDARDELLELEIPAL